MPFPLDYVQDGDWETVRRNTDQTAARLNPVLPQARVYNSANISTNNTTVTTLTFNSKRYDNGSLWAGSGSKLTAPITGLYMIGGHVSFASNATGLRLARILLNGATVIGTHSEPAVNGDLTIMSVTTQYQLAAGEYVELQAYQSSGGALNVEAHANYSPEFWMHRVGGYVNMGV